MEHGRRRLAGIVSGSVTARDAADAAAAASDVDRRHAV